MRGAGGTSGGTGQFFLGLVMMCGGFYLLLNSVVVSSAFGWSTRLFGVGSVGITGGIILMNMHLRTMSAFELICILVLAFGGLGLFLRSLRGQAQEEAAEAGQARLRP